jgi:hypothetical protein
MYALSCVRQPTFNGCSRANARVEFGHRRRGLVRSLQVKSLKRFRRSRGTTLLGACCDRPVYRAGDRQADRGRKRVACRGSRAGCNFSHATRVPPQRFPRVGVLGTQLEQVVE